MLSGSISASRSDGGMLAALARRAKRPPNDRCAIDSACRRRARYRCARVGVERGVAPRYAPPKRAAPLGSPLVLHGCGPPLGSPRFLSAPWSSTVSGRPLVLHGLGPPLGSPRSRAAPWFSTVSARPLVLHGLGPPLGSGLVLHLHFLGSAT
jgi:hypothetical protein